MHGVFYGYNPRPPPFTYMGWGLEKEEEQSQVVDEERESIAQKPADI